MSCLDEECGRIWGVVTSSPTHWKIYSKSYKRNTSMSCGSVPAHGWGHNHRLKCSSDFTVSIKCKSGVWAAALSNLEKVLATGNRYDSETRVWLSSDFDLFAACLSACKQHFVYTSLAPVGAIKSSLNKSMVCKSVDTKEDCYSPCKQNAPAVLMDGIHAV